MVAGYLGVLRGHARRVSTATLQEIHYSDQSEPTAPEKIRLDRRLARLHRQILGGGAHARPDPAAHRELPCTQKQDDRDVYQTDYLAKDADRRRSRARNASYQDQLFAGAKVVKTIDAIGEKYNIDRLRPDDRLGLVLFPDQADVLAARLAQGPRRQFRRRHPDRHRAGQAAVLPARQQVLRLDEQDEEAAAGDGEAQGSTIPTTG